MGFILRPFAALGRLGGGVLLSGGIGRHFRSPLHIQGIFDPVGLSLADQDRSITVANAAVIASYDVRFFEIGLGLGGQSVNSTQPFLEPGSGLALAQLIRLGARDGLNLTARSSVVLFHSELGFGGMIATVQVPVGTGYWLTLGGGGGDLGYGYGELGLRALVEGTGGAGSKFLYVSAGGASIFEARKDCSICTNSNGGPMAGIGGEWRF